MKDHLQFADRVDAAFIELFGDIDVQKLELAIVNWFEADDCLGDGALAAAGFADDAQGASASNVEADIVGSAHVLSFFHSNQARHRFVGHRVIYFGFFDGQHGFVGGFVAFQRGLVFQRFRLGPDLFHAFPVAAAPQTAHQMTGGYFQQRRVGDAAIVVGLFAAWRKNATGGQVGRGRNAAGNWVQGACAFGGIHIRQAAHQAHGVGVHRVVENLVGGGQFDDFTGVHDGDFV